MAKEFGILSIYRFFLGLFILYHEALPWSLALNSTRGRRFGDSFLFHGDDDDSFLFHCIVACIHFIRSVFISA